MQRARKILMTEPVSTPVSTIDRIRLFPWFSAAAAMSSVGLLAEDVDPLLIPIIFASPMISAGLAIPAAINMVDKKRPVLSRIFSAAAAATGLAGPAVLLSTPGPDALGAVFFTAISMGVAGALNVGAHLLRNMGKIGQNLSGGPPPGP
jgi:hypothetical protein